MKIKTVSLTGDETKIEFDKCYSFIEINNTGSSEILISAKAGIVRGNDDVIILAPKQIVTVGDAGSPGIKEIYISGNGEIQLIGKNFAEHSFKLPASGGNSDDPAEVLKFLPHPEGIYAYWDWQNGVENFTWTDMINNTKLNAINNTNFVVENNWIYLNGGNADQINAELPIKDLNSVVVYFVYCAGVRTRLLSSSTNDYVYVDAGSPGLPVYIYLDNELLQNRKITTASDYSCGSFINAATTIRLFTTSYYGNRTIEDFGTVDYTFRDILGISDRNIKYKAILLSDDISNVDNIKENIRALEQHYFSA